MRIREGGLLFDCSKALDAFKFDEGDHSQPRFHGLSHCMKAVDLVVELPDHYLFIEVKEPTNPKRYNDQRNRTTLIKELVGKFRDTMLYRWAEDKLDKPVKYVCLIEVGFKPDNALWLGFMDNLRRQLPYGKASQRWKRSLATGCMVLNSQLWNQQFPDLPVSRMNGDAS